MLYSACRTQVCDVQQCEVREGFLVRDWRDLVYILQSDSGCAKENGLRVEAEKQRNQFGDYYHNLHKDVCWFGINW